MYFEVKYHSIALKFNVGNSVLKPSLNSTVQITWITQPATDSQLMKEWIRIMVNTFNILGTPETLIF